MNVIWFVSSGDCFPPVSVAVKFQSTPSCRIVSFRIPISSLTKKQIITQLINYDVSLSNRAFLRVIFSVIFQKVVLHLNDFVCRCPGSEKLSEGLDDDNVDGDSVSSLPSDEGANLDDVEDDGWEVLDKPLSNSNHSSIEVIHVRANCAAPLANSHTC